jgi:hypothetical protein
VKTKVEIMDAKSVDGNLDNGSVAYPGRERNPDHFLFLDDALAIAFQTQKQPITA